MDFEQFRRETEEEIQSLLKENFEQMDNKETANLISAIRERTFEDILDILERYHKQVVLE